MTAAALALHATEDGFVARRKLLADLVEALRGGASRVLVGAPGVGKTRLAAECLRELSDEAPLVCKLADVTDREGFVARVAGVLGVWLAPTFDRAESEARVARALGARGPGLIVLDNFEQLPAEVDELLEGWMRSSATSFLVTSRRRLGCSAEHVEVPPLDTASAPNGWSEAATLLRQRAHELGKARLEQEDREAIEDLAKALDGLPLAIEMAAARLAVLTPAQLLGRLGERFAILDGGRSRLGAALEASLTLLDDAALDCLRACGVFRGGVRLEALEHVLGPGHDVLGALATLRGHSLLSVERAGAVNRYSLAHSVRDLVEARERDNASWSAARARHAAYWADAAAAELEDPRLLLEIENLRFAFDWARREGPPELAGRLALALSSPALGLPYGEAERVVDAALGGASEGSLPEALEAQLRFRRGTVRRFLSSFEAATRDLERAGEIARRVGDRSLEAEVLAGLGHALSGSADWEGSRAYLERALAVHPDPTFRPLVLAMIANTFSNEDAFDRAEPMLREAVAGADVQHDAYAGAFARLSLGILLVERGAFDEAFGCLVDSLSVFESSRSTRVMQARHLRAVALTHLARVKQETGDTSGALSDYHEAVSFAEEAGVRRAEAFALHGLASLLLELGELRAADDRIRAALPLMRENAKDAEGAIVALQGVLFALRGAHEDAERFFRRAQALLAAHKRPVFAAALSVLRGEEGEAAASHAEYADVRLARRLRASFSKRQTSPPLFVSEDGSFFRSPETGQPVSLARRKAVRGILRALIEARQTRPGVPVSVEALIAAGWPGEKVLPGAGAERVYAAIATLRRLGLRGLISQSADGYLVPADRAVIPHDPGA